jgi:XXXCH domain-containing protein
MKPSSPSEIAERKYRPLKKELRLFYKKIKLGMERETLPALPLLSDFMALSQLMLSYPGFGNYYYDEFRRACLAFEKYCRGKDLGKAQEAFSLIGQIKHDCHQRAQQIQIISPPPISSSS